MERLYLHLKRASLSPTGERKPSSKWELRTSFVKRCKNQMLNEKIHLIRTLNSTLKVRGSDKPFLTYKKNLLKILQFCLQVLRYGSPFLPLNKKIKTVIATFHLRIVTFYLRVVSLYQNLPTEAKQG